MEVDIRNVARFSGAQQEAGNSYYRLFDTVIPIRKDLNTRHEQGGSQFLLWPRPRRIAFDKKVKYFSEPKGDPA